MEVVAMGDMVVTEAEGMAAMEETTAVMEVVDTEVTEDTEAMAEDGDHVSFI